VVGALTVAVLSAPGVARADGAGLFALPAERMFAMDLVVPERPRTSIVHGLAGLLGTMTEARASGIRLSPWFSGLQAGGMEIQGTVCEAGCERTVGLKHATAPSRPVP